MSKSTEQSIKHKLKDISKNLGIPFNSLLEMLFLERFLVRIQKNQYNNLLSKCRYLYLLQKFFYGFFTGHFVIKGYNFQIGAIEKRVLFFNTAYKIFIRE